MSATTGMNRQTGKALSGADHLAQSVGDILTTPIGTRIMRRDYGSMLMDLLDQPLNSATRLLLITASDTALRKWEPRLKARRFRFDFEGAASGQVGVQIEGERTDLPRANERITLSIPIRTGGASPVSAS
ncbi:GPW/gp25 family protein [Altericroceibacterium endophyticum]|uniref:Oxidoreductase n=1 Tax=Altericroceibacterium endophyticum TaxID=1808508 RepID=A0A6I4T4J5_9SPHN|nr:GPW/gp25 family protein [Altericroceibacterium endophyticum]MXO64860.1 oxidoreductase [Altericroceibacterium endophyticum]